MVDSAVTPPSMPHRPGVTGIGILIAIPVSLVLWAVVWIFIQAILRFIHQ
ncbi:MAG: hypothetical protein JWL88_182 [Parcubacteria group bacterium]|nr:hypothetical protein [Parcubacteria group bacterium]